MIEKYRAGTGLSAEEIEQVNRLKGYGQIDTETRRMIDTAREGYIRDLERGTESSKENLQGAPRFGGGRRSEINLDGLDRAMGNEMKSQGRGHRQDQRRGRRTETIRRRALSPSEENRD